MDCKELYLICDEVIKSNVVVSKLQAVGYTPSTHSNNSDANHMALIYSELQMMRKSINHSKLQVVNTILGRKVQLLVLWFIQYYIASFNMCCVARPYQSLFHFHRPGHISVGSGGVLGVIPNLSNGGVTPPNEA